MERAASTGAGAAANEFGTGGKENGAVVPTAKSEALLRVVAKANGAVVPVREANVFLGGKFEAGGDSSNLGVCFYCMDLRSDKGSFNVPLLSNIDTLLEFGALFLWASS